MIGILALLLLLLLQGLRKPACVCGRLYINKRNLRHHRVIEAEALQFGEAQPKPKPKRGIFMQ